MLFCFPLTTLPARSSGCPGYLMWPFSPNSLNQASHFCMAFCISSGDRPVGSSPRNKKANSLIGLLLVYQGMRTLRVNGLNVWPIICTRVRVSAHVLTKTLAIIRVRRSLPGLQVSFEAEKIKAPTRCRARISLVGTRETTMGKEKGRVVSVGLQVELDVVTLPGGVGDLPVHASGRVKLFDRYLGHKPLAIEPELSGAADFRVDGSVARPPLTNSIG